jgi:TonB family protein
MADPWVRPPSPGPPDSGVSTRPEDEARSASGKTPSSDDYLLIDRLREDAAAGRMDLSSILSEATHAARYFTDATGAALALWSQGVVICRARSGDAAPPLGAKVDVDSGVSGECLRSGRSQRCNDTLTDPRVDSEVCQEMGIRALAAVPLRGGQGVIGILEVFSDRPNAFSDAHITLLKKLAQIAVTGRAQSVSPAAPAEIVPHPEPASSHEPTVVDRFNFLNLWPARMRGEEGQPLRLVAAALLLVLLGFFGWMLSRSRGPSRGGQAVHAASSEAVPALMAAGADRITPSPLSDAGKSTGTITLGRGAKPAPDLVAKDVVQRASTSVVTGRGAPLQAKKSDDGDNAPSSKGAPTPEQNASLDVPAPDPSEMIAGMPGGVAPVAQSVVNPQPIFPFVALPVSQGVTGGRITHKVDPIYPTEARRQKVEGAVMLDILVGEDGNVHEVHVTSGPPLLAKAATEAVKRWRYQPFQLNGRPVSIHNQITIQFKLP